MLKALDVLVLDIETTCTVDPVVMDRIASKVKPPATMSVPATIAKWEKEKKPDAIKEAISRTALGGAYGQIVAIGYGAIYDGQDQPVRVETSRDEKSLLYDLMSLPVDHGCFPKLVGHHISGFDIPLIRQRCIVNGIKMAHWFPKDPKPWSDTICDTMVAWAGARDTISLSELAFVLGIEVAETIPGSEVPQAWADGMFEDVLAHCSEDVRVTREIYKRIVAAGL